MPTPQQISDQVKIIRKIMTDYRDHDLSEDQFLVKTYQYTTRFTPMNASMSSLFITATTPIAAAIKLYDYIDANMLRVDRWIDLYNQYEHEIIKSDGDHEYIGKMIVEGLLDGDDDIRLYESSSPTVI